MPCQKKSQVGVVCGRWYPPAARWWASRFSMGAFKIPAAGRKCEKVVAPKSAFHKRSFRWVKSGKGRVLVGCPKKSSGGLVTAWKESARKGSQCRLKSSGKRAGLKAHAVVTSRAKAGTCRLGTRRR